MNGDRKTALAERREGFDRELESTLDRLARDGEYPEVLVDSLRSVLFPAGREAPRGVPLLLMELYSGLDGAVAVAAEMAFRGALLLAVLSDEESEASGADDTTVGSPDKKNDPAQLLLAADTLLTLPFELLESEIAGRLARCLGTEGLLGELDDRGGPEDGSPLRRLLAVDPVMNLVAALGPDDGGREPCPEPVCRAVYLTELLAWFGPADIAADELDSELDKIKTLARDDMSPGLLAEFLAGR